MALYAAASSVASRLRSGHQFNKAMSARIDEDHLLVVAAGSAGSAFHSMLAVFPALAAMVAITATCSTRRMAADFRHGRRVGEH